MEIITYYQQKSSIPSSPSHSNPCANAKAFFAPCSSKKVCPLCSDKNFVLDYKNIDIMKKFVNDKGKILPRRTTGSCSKHQKENFFIPSLA